MLLDSGNKSIFVRSQLSDFHEGLQTSNATLNVALFELIHRSFMSDPNFCLSWAESSFTFLMKIWRHLSYSLLNKGNRLMEAIMKVCITSISLANFPADVGQP
jgi:hypothetical protein